MSDPADGFRTVGQPAAVAVLRAMLAGRVPHAILLVGPSSVGKTTLAEDLAAALLCTGASGAARPCRACPGCRMVEHGNHPDLHRLEPGGAGAQIRIGEVRDPAPGTVRWLIGRFALHASEGGARVAIVRDAQRMGDDAQSALLKTLEEPPAGAVIVLVTDDEEQLLPTVRSRCARVRLGTVRTRDIEQLLQATGRADPPTGARLARLSGGRPGVAMAYASTPEAAAIHGELTRTLLDLLAASRADRLGAAKGLIARSLQLRTILAAARARPDAGDGDAQAPAKRGAARRGRRGATAAAADQATVTDAAAADSEQGETTEAPTGAGKTEASERRGAVGLLLDLWRDLARDLALVELGRTDVADPGLLEELEATARRLPRGASAAAIARLIQARSFVDGNVSPELVLDVTLLAWPRITRAAA